MDNRDTGKTDGKSEETNFLLKERISAEREEAEAELLGLLDQLTGLLAPAEQASFQDAQSRWEEFRDASRNYSASRFPEGSNSSLDGAVAWIEETKRRASMLRRDIEARERE